ncbi:hypothetical protein V1527DRAFT_477490 [Lipomyces starkeyi]
MFLFWFVCLVWSSGLPATDSWPGIYNRRVLSSLSGQGKDLVFQIFLGIIALPCLVAGSTTAGEDVITCGQQSRWRRCREERRGNLEEHGVYTGEVIM